ncbi:hypothetical protein [Jeotgalibacillus proteolyticus]|uniref:hypothetical protein n=1 Tax=Jeotgalibacillus proteolyticus TaxID=2082395 RepID=UPI003CF28B99
MRKVYLALLFVLGLNTSRYLTYLLEGDGSNYYGSMFILNAVSFLGVIIYIFFTKNKKTYQTGER